MTSVCPSARDEIVALYWIEGLLSGRLGIAPRPRGGDWLELDVECLQSAGVNVLVSLLTKEEVVELMLVDEPGVCSANAIEFVSLPIADRSIPRSREEVFGLVARIRGALREGKSVAIHCRAGMDVVVRGPE